MPRRRFLAIFAVVLLAGVLPGRAAMQQVADLFDAARYGEAREMISNAEEGVRPAEDLLWQSRLATEPEQALDLLREARTAGSLPTSATTRIALEIAELEAARGRPEAALGALAPILSESAGDLPGAAYLRAGQCYHALGNLQRAREMLASIRPEDAAFVRGRTLLGEIGLQQDDPALALRYFESAAASDPAAVEPVLAAGLWEALRRTGEHERADRLAAGLQRNHPGSLALLQINRVLRSEREELAARATTDVAPVDSVATRQDDRSGRFCLQLGAFSDRGLALEFLQRFSGQLPDLRVEPVRDDRGQVLYKLRSGSYVNPALAETEARRLERRLGVDVIVADLAD